MSNYLAIIGDLLASRKMKEREVVQEKLKLAFDRINKHCKPLIVSKFTLTLGDEFQAVLKVGANAWNCLDILESWSPVPYRMGIGYGAISTKIDPELSLGADGEAYWNAREAIREVHSQNWNGKCHVLFHGTKPDQDFHLNTLIMAGETFKSSWTSLQKETFATLLEMGIYNCDFNQNEAAQYLGISASALSKRLTAGNIKAYLRIRESLAMLTERYHD